MLSGCDRQPHGLEGFLRLYYSGMSRITSAILTHQATSSIPAISEYSVLLFSGRLARERVPDLLHACMKDTSGWLGLFILLCLTLCDAGVV